MKILGVYVDDNLNFTEHMSELCIRTSQKVGVLSRILPHVSSNII